MPRITMLAGAPSFPTYSKPDLTIATWLPAFSAFLNLKPQEPLHSDSSTVSHITPSTGTVEPTAPNLPAWRTVPLSRVHLPTGFSQRGWLDEALGLSSPVDHVVEDGVSQANEQEQDFVAQDMVDESPTRRLSTFKKPLPKAIPARASKDADHKQKEILLSQYLERSFALHDAIHSSQVIPADESTLLEVEDRAAARPSHMSRVSQQQPEHDEESEIEATFFTSNSSQTPLPTQTIDDVTFTSTYPASTAPESTSNSTSTTSTTSDSSSTLRPPPRGPLSSHQPRPPGQVPSAPHLLPLTSLPTPSHLHAIHPQTMTVDLIVGIISTSSLRIVTVRRTGRQVGVLELLVGDETRAGFGVTFWVDVTQEESQRRQSHAAAREVRDELRESLEMLRKGDVVLLRNVALSEFQKMVRGNSLGCARKGGGGRGGNVTSVALLWRAGWMRDVIGQGQGGIAEAIYDSEELDDDDENDEHGESRICPQVTGRDGVVIEKTKRVRDWTRRFIPAVTAGTTPTRRKEKRRRGTDDNERGKRRRVDLDEEEDSVMSRAGGAAFGMMDELPPDDSMLTGGI